MTNTSAVAVVVAAAAAAAAPTVAAAAVHIAAVVAAVTRKDVIKQHQGVEIIYRMELPSQHFFYFSMHG